MSGTILRTVDLSADAGDASAIAAGDHLVATLAGGGTLATVAGVGQRLAVADAAADDVLVQTPERPAGARWVRVAVTALLGGTLAGRKAEVGFIDGDDGAFFRINDGVLTYVVSSGAVEKEFILSATTLGIQLTKVQEWGVRVFSRRQVVFQVNGTDVASLSATTLPLTELARMRVGVRLTNPGAASGSAVLDVHSLIVDADAHAEPARYVTEGAAEDVAGVRTEGGLLHRVRAVDTSGATRYLMLFDKASAPVNGDVPRLRASGPEASLTFDRPLRFAAGIQLAWSSTADVLTLPAAAGYYEVDHT